MAVVYRGISLATDSAGLDGDILAVAVDPDGYLMAAVAGRGMFRARLP